MRRLVRCLEALSDGAGYAAGITVFGLTLLIAAGVFSRRVLGSPLLSVDEVSGYLLLAIVFLGLAPTMKAGGHIPPHHPPPPLPGGGAWRAGGAPHAPRLPVRAGARRRELGPRRRVLRARDSVLQVPSDSALDSRLLARRRGDPP